MRLVETNSLNLLHMRVWNVHFHANPISFFTLTKPQSRLGSKTKKMFHFTQYNTHIHRDPMRSRSNNTEDIFV